ncbi:MAG: hypothetical protein HXY34_10070 [Candidatus Thorarchaeota archaeon]|nr:hypothetical protein [Candidatus Thorarchaeota archaeon]
MSLVIHTISQVRGGLVLTATTIVVLLICSNALPVHAAVATLWDMEYTQVLTEDTNGHSYVVDDDPYDWATFPNYLLHRQDVGINATYYYRTEWDREEEVLAGPSETLIYLDEPSESWGWLSNTTVLTRFLELSNMTNEDLSLTVRMHRMEYGLNVGAPNTILLRSGYAAVGTFNLTNEEFIHVALSSNQDDIAIMAVVFGPDHRGLGEAQLTEGESTVMPFRTSGPGMYYMLFISEGFNSAYMSVDVTITPITPTALSAGSYVEGTLEGGEIVLNDDGSVTHRERVPQAHTYKFATNSTHPGLIHLRVNYPEMVLYPAFSPYAIITSTANTETGIPAVFLDAMDINYGVYPYQSFQGEVYYLTVIGQDGATYTIYNEVPSLNLLPVNSEFYIDNILQQRRTVAYSLPLATDSVLKVNSSLTVGGFEWRVFRVFEDMNYRVLSVSASDNFDLAQTYYLPAGNYLVVGRSSTETRGLYEFNLGPVVSGAGGVAVDNGRLIGLKVPTQVYDLYTMNVTLTTHDNITVSTGISMITNLGMEMVSSSATLGNRQNGLRWEAHGANRTTLNTGAVFNDGFGVIVLSPYSVVNNTGGLGGNHYYHYTVDYFVTFEEWDYFNGSSTFSVAASPVWHNITLGDPGDAEENYKITMGCTPDTWFTVEVFTDDVSDWEVSVYQSIDGKSQFIPWYDIENDVLEGTVEKAKFQVGSLTDELVFFFSIDRSLVDEGRLDIRVTPHVMNYMAAPPIVYRAGSAVQPTGEFPVLALAGVSVAAAVVVIAVVVYLKKKK